MGSGSGVAAVSRPRLLDLFAGAQGAGVGYARAGFEVHAVDVVAHARRPEVASFVVADALEVLADVGFCRSFDVVHASPPCHDHSALAAETGLDGTGHILGDTLKALRSIGVPWVVENVEGSPLGGELMLCGSMFGLGATCRDGVWRQLRRHRLFASSEWLMGPGRCSHRVGPVGVYGTGGGGQMTRGYKGTLAESRAAMGCPWMTRVEVSQAIPPAYTAWVGEQLLERMAVAS